MGPKLIRHARLLTGPSQMIRVDLHVPTAVRENEIVLAAKHLEEMACNHGDGRIVERVNLCAIALRTGFGRLHRVSANL